MTLAAKQCVPCRGGIPPLPREDAEHLLAETPGWSLDERATRIERSFRFPDFARGLNVPGFHLHFLTADRMAGGPVLDLTLVRGELAIDASAHFHLELPTDPTFLHASLGHERGDALDRAERGK